MSYRWCRGMCLFAWALSLLNLTSLVFRCMNFFGLFLLCLPFSYLHSFCLLSCFSVFFHLLTWAELYNCVRNLRFIFWAQTLDSKCPARDMMTANPVWVVRIFKSGGFSLGKTLKCNQIPSPQHLNNSFSLAFLQCFATGMRDVLDSHIW